MRKFYLFMLMAVGLLISASMSAALERPVKPTEPKEGIEMPEATMPEHPALPEKGLVKKTFNKVAKQTPNKAPMDGELFSIAKPEGEPYKTSSFPNAIMAAKNNSNPIVLLQDASGVWGSTIDANITVDLNGFNLSLDGITIKEGCTLTLNNSQTGPNTVTLNNDKDIYGGVEYSVYAGSIAKADNVTLSITGGEFTATAATALSSYLNLTDNKLVNSYNSELGACLCLVPNSYQCEAKIGEIEYATLDAALSIAADGNTVTMLQNIDYACEIDKAIVLDMNGKYIYDPYSQVLLEINANATVENGYVISYSDYYYDENGLSVSDSYGIVVHGEVTLDNVQVYGSQKDPAYSILIERDNSSLLIKGSSKIYSTYFGITLCNKSNATIQGNTYVYGGYYGVNNEQSTTSKVTISTSNTIKGGYYALISNATAIINGGIFEGAYAIYNEPYGVLTINDGVITGASNYFGLYNQGGIAYINGGKFTGGYGIENVNKTYTGEVYVSRANAEIEGVYYGIYNCGKLEITDGKIKGAKQQINNSWWGAVGNVGENASSTISGGVFEGGIGVGNMAKGTKMTISGGTFNATSMALYTKGESTTINVTDGVINSDSYGIYALSSATNSIITIDGGTFQAKDNIIYTGAGTATINGGKFYKPQGTVFYTYSDGVVKVEGGFYPSNNVTDLGVALQEGYSFGKPKDGLYPVIISVAETGGYGYATLAEAIADAEEGATIKLVNNVTEDVTINKPITLNTTAYSYSLNGKVTADGAKVKIMGDGGVADFEEINGGQIEIVSGTFTKDPSDYLADRSVIVEGTTYTVVHSVLGVEISRTQTEYFSDLKSAFDYVQNLEGDNYVIDVLEDFEFKVDNGRYITLNKGKNITLNLNGHHVHGIMDAHETITSWAEMIYVKNGHFIVEDLSGDETGIMSFEQINPEPKTWYGNYMINVQSGATFTLKSGTLTNNTKHSTFAIAVSVEIEGGTANIEGGKILGVNSTSCIRPYNSGTLNISGGYLSATAYHMIFIQQHESGSNKIEVNITGGEFEHLGGGHAISCFATNVGQLRNCTVNINGGKFDSRAIGFFLSGDEYHWGGTAWNRDDWNALYRNLFHATSGYFADNTFYIEGTDADENTVVYTPYLSEILDPEYDLFEQDNVDYPYYVGPKVITESTGNGNWNELFPDSEGENIQVEHQVTVVEGYTKAYSLNVQSTGEVIVKEGATLDLTWGLVMEDGAKMTIEPGAAVIVGVAGIQNTSNSFIVVQTDLNNSAILSIDPEAFLFSDPYIRVEYTTAAYRTTKTTESGDIQWYKWQDFGIPTRKAPNFVAVEPTTWIMRWNVENGEYENVTGATLNEPFRGYIITNQLSAPGYTYIMTGRMNAAENQKFNFAVTGNQEEENFNFFANSYLTPMDIKTFLQGLSDEDDNIERTVHVFNSGTDTYESINLSDLKFNLADFTTIAPMQAFYMSTKNKVAAQATLNYRNSVWGQKSTEPMHAPQRVQNDANVFNLYAGTGKAKDKLSFIESSNYTAEYENGYDAIKYMNKDFNIFVATERGKQSVVATDNIEGTILTFQAGDAVEYQLSFDRVQCDEYSIMDLMTGCSVDISEGNTYNFVAEPKSTEARFQIIPKTPWVATGVDEVSGNTNSKGIYTILGQYVGSSAEWDKLSAGVYIVDGIKIVK